MTRTWRDRVKVHSAADLFPMMSDAELELAVDSKERGLREYCTSIKDCGADHYPYHYFLLDGQNQLEAICRVRDAEKRDY